MKILHAILNIREKKIKSIKFDISNLNFEHINQLSLPQLSINLVFVEIECQNIY
jgi:hypothetical protein